MRGYKSRPRVGSLLPGADGVSAPAARCGVLQQSARRLRQVMDTLEPRESMTFGNKPTSL